MMIDAIASLAGLIVPPVFTFLKEKFVKPANDNPETTLNSLAITKPEIMAPYIDAEAKLLDAQVKFFNRDVIGATSLWVANLRASIRPLFVCVSLVAIICDIFWNVQIDPSLRAFMEMNISSWFGDRIFRK
jgi:hypothetical protein